MKRIFVKITAITLLIAFVMICILMLSGCSQSYYDSRNIRRMQAYMPHYQAPASALANQLWPCFKGPMHSDTVTIFGPGETTFKKGDSVVIRIRDAVKITYHDTVFKTNKVIKIVHDTVTDGRTVSVLTLQLKDTNDSLKTRNGQLSQSKQDTAEKSKWVWILGGAWVVLIVGLIIWQVVKYYTGGAVKTAGGLLKKL